jgi:pterin-4a-carbinolamine dehydratase
MDSASESGGGGSKGHAWRNRTRPLRLERRICFPDYEATRAFLEDSEPLSEETGIYPNLSFGRTYVNLTLFAEEGEEEISEQLNSFAERIDALAKPHEETEA